MEKLNSIKDKVKLSTLLRVGILGYISLKALFRIYWEIRARSLVRAARKFGEKERSVKF